MPAALLFYNFKKEKKKTNQISDAFSLFLKAIINNWLVGETFECLPSNDDQPNFTMQCEILIELRTVSKRRSKSNAIENVFLKIPMQLMNASHGNR